MKHAANLPYALLCWLVLTTPSIALANKLTDIERDTIIADLREPILVHLENGQTIPGHSIDISEEQIKIATAKGAGEVIYTFHVDQVARFTIPGESYKTLATDWLNSGEAGKALELMELLYRQRVKILSLLPPAESHFFIHYVDLILQSPKPARAIGVADILRPQISSEKALHALDDAILDSYNTLQLYEEVRTLTQQWLEQRNPYSGSALGYYTHSADRLRQEQYEAAIESALQPIVFGTPNPPAYLEHCYAAAISAAIGLRDRAHAFTLYDEMEERHLKWPESDPTFKPFREKLDHYLEKRSTPPAP